MKQLGQAFLQYTQDWDDRTPPVQTMNPDNSTRQAWPDLFFPYVKNEALFNCPTAANGNFYKYSENRKISGGSNYGTYNAAAVYTTGTSRPYSLVRDPRYYLPHMAEVGQPTETLLLTDGYPGRFFLSFGQVGTATQPVIYPGSSLKGNPRVLGRADNPAYGAVERHTGSVNVLWGDGHVKAVSLDRLLQTASQPQPAYNSPHRFLRYFTIEID